jgi:hypothetical protein
MSILWFFIGLALGLVYMWLQWIQVKNINPCKSTIRASFMFGYAGRLALFVVIASFALRENLLFGLVMFAGFWIARSLALVFIGSGRIHWPVRRNL